jgi:hypothetical protein
MYRPDRWVWAFKSVAGLAGGMVALWQRPVEPPTPRHRIYLRVAASVIATVALAAGAWFTQFTFSETDPWARWVSAMVTFGVFGFPSSILALLVAVVYGKAGGGQEGAESLCATLMAVTYFAQWLFIAAGLLRRSMF